MSEYQIADLSGETVYKQPGSINGESFVLKNLEGCSVYLLDYTSEVEVTNCNNCQIFIGPVDGPAIFDSCSNSTVAVACQQFQARTCSNVEFGLYCATHPSISSSTGIRFSCWAGAYPGLTGHFALANLDPKQNNWNKVFDGSAEEEGDSNFTLLEGIEYWEVPLEGAGTLENPVSGPDGTPYQPPEEEEAAAPAVESAPLVFEAPAENGVGAAALVTPVEEDGPEHPAVAAMRERMRARVREQSSHEGGLKEELRAHAKQWLDAFNEQRLSLKAKRAADNRAAQEEICFKGISGDSDWERVLSLINLNTARADLARFKAVLHSAKAHNPKLALAA